MSGAVSPVSSGRRYGLAAVCRAWRVPRASVYLSVVEWFGTAAADFERRVRPIWVEG